MEDDRLLLELLAGAARVGSLQHDAARRAAHGPAREAEAGHAHETVLQFPPATAHGPVRDE